MSKNITLRWCPTDALTEWAHAHFYYLPECIMDKEYETWACTMQDIMLELGDRGFKVELRSNKKED